MEDPSIQHDQKEERFSKSLKEGEAYLNYRNEGKLLDLYSTYVPDNARGKGVAGELVEAALAYARENAYQIRPSCPYVAAYIERHPEHEDLKA
jgi:hypothetical protein